MPTVWRAGAQITPEMLTNPKLRPQFLEHQRWEKTNVSVVTVPEYEGEPLEFPQYSLAFPGDWVYLTETENVVYAGSLDERMERSRQFHILPDVIHQVVNEDKGTCQARDARSVVTAPEDLTFTRLRQANVQRCEESFHPLLEWNPLEWAGAMAGEAGEACNLAKKLRRLEVADKAKDTGKVRSRLAFRLALEIADTVIYADLLAARLGYRLDRLVRYKFNQVSKRRKSSRRLPAVSVPQPENEGER